ncbi:MAG: D-alanyl-D-alanine carboxypeptidase family protein [Gammaproteobacteria bacterium]|jgi:D-alanyl-D-alanine carboxypeptidase (penicillin-binding protein 5/6)
MTKQFAFPSLILALLLAIALPARAIPVPAAPGVDAKSYIVMDAHSGRIVASEDPDQRVEPASITKMMTAYVVFHALKEGTISMDDMVPISEKAWREPGSRMFVEVGNKVSVRNLIQGMVIQSGNDASVALAQYVAGAESTFADLMNHYAKQLGMDHTHYANATGLPHAEHYTTAHDIARLARALIREFPEDYKMFSEKEFTWNGIHQDNRNTLLWRDPSVDGIKTGHTESAGYCLVASAKQGEMRLISVVMGASTEKARIDSSQALLNYGFRFFETHRLYGAGEKLTTATVWKGEQDDVAVGLNKDLYVTIPRGTYKKLSASMDLRSQLTAPVTASEDVGRVKVTLDGKDVAQAPLIALKPVAEGGLWTRLVDSVVLWFK